MRIGQAIVLAVWGGLLAAAAPAVGQMVASPDGPAAPPLRALQSRSLDRRALFRIVAGFYNLDPALLEAVAAVESGGDAGAISPAGAQGLMQLMPGTAERFRVEDPFDPVDNVLGAARLLDYLRRWQAGQTAASLPELLAAYNAGEGAVFRYGGIPPYAETRAYVRRVLSRYLGMSLALPPAWQPRWPGKARLGGRVDGARAPKPNPLDELMRRRAVALKANRAFAAWRNQQ